MKVETLQFGQVTISLFNYQNYNLEDFIDFLLPEEIEKLINIKHPDKKIEFAATRSLRTKIFGKSPICYSSIGAPSIEGKPHISISHSKNLVGIAHCSSFLIGLDIEFIREKVLRVQNKFLNEQEKRAVNKNSMEEVSKFWSGKEALYKLAGRKKIIFAENLFLEKIDSTNWKGKIQFKNQLKKVNLNIVKKENYIISVNPTPVYDVK